MEAGLATLVGMVVAVALLGLWIALLLAMILVLWVVTR